MIIGVTGGTGCGKTTLLQVAADRGALVLDCDVIYHNLLQAGGEMVEKICARFPHAVENGRLNRKKLGAVVFADPVSLTDLNAITHRFVHKEVMQALANPKPVTVIDAIGLFESGLSQLCDCTVAVTAPEESRVSRLMHRDGITKEYALSRIRAQKSQNEYAALCDYSLENNGTEAEFTAKCIAFFEKLDMIEENT